jgi:hypothetical protein
MGQRVATLEIGYEMATSGAVAQVEKLGGAIDKTTATAIRQLDEVERATSTAINTGPAIERLKALGSASALAGAAAVREFNRIERAGESLSSQLDRQISTFGKTSTEIRQMKVETAALAAAQAGQTELATRLRAQEADLYAMEFAAARQARLEQQALAEERDAAAARATADAAREATAMREAAAAHQMFEARVRSGVTAMREQEAAAARDAATLQHLKEMLDPAAAAEARLIAIMEDARRVMTAAGLSAEEVARAQALLAQRGGAVVSGLGAQRAGFQQLAMNMGDVATEYQGGIKLSTIFAQQSGQVAQAIALVAGEAKGFAGFLGGPWFIALTAAVTLIMALANSHGEAKSKAEQEAEALKTVKGAIDALDEATGRLHKSKQQQIADSAAATQGLLREALAHRQVLAAQQQGYTDQLNQPGVGGDALASSVALSLTARSVAANDAKIKSLQDALSGVGFAKAVDAASAATNKAAKATQDYEAQIARIEGAWGRSGKTARDQVLVQQLVADAMRKRDAATKTATGSVGSMINADAALASASTSVQRAEANVAKVRAENAQALAAHSITQAQATARLATAERGLYAARDATKAHTASMREAAKAAREQDQFEDHLSDTLFRQRAGVEQLIDSYTNWGSMPSITAGIDMGKLADQLGPALDLVGDMNKALDEISRNASDTASNLSDAWGNVGRSIGDAMEILVDYGARQAELDERRRAAAGDQEKIDHIARQSADLQLNSLIGITDATKGLFKTHSTAYKAMEAAEKVLTVVQLARTVAAITGNAAIAASDTARAGVEQGNSYGHHGG